MFLFVINPSMRGEVAELRFVSNTHKYLQNLLAQISVHVVYFFSLDVYFNVFLQLSMHLLDPSNQNLVQRSPQEYKQNKLALAYMFFL